MPQHETQTKPAILGGEPAMNIPQPAWPVIDEDDVSRLTGVIRSGKWSWIGEQEMAFCKEYAEFIGTKYCIGLANGTVTLQCALQALGVVPGDEVIVPGLTWVATAQAAMDIGANVVLVDIDPETLCISPESIRNAVTEKTKAILPVHLYGCMCDMDAVMEIARSHNLKVLEDVAHQHGSAWRGKKAGSIGDAGSFSFQQSKILTSGEGGAVTCDDDEVYRTVFALKQVGWMPDPATPHEPGRAPKLVPGNRYCHNYRITEMQAALLRGGLSRLDAQNQRREDNAQYIAERLNRIGGPLRAVKRDPRVTQQAYYAMTLVFDPESAAGVSRDQYINALHADGCELTKPYSPVYANPIMNLYDPTSPIPFRNLDTTQDYRNLKLPNVEKAVTQTAVLIMHMHLLGNRSYIDRMLDAIEKINGNLPAIREYFESVATT